MITGTGRIAYDPLEDRAALSFPESLAELGVRAGEHTVQALCAAPGGVMQPLIGRTRPSTFHPLGGVVMGLNADTFGRIHGMPGLYALDGSLIPGVTPLSNPAWTIAAIAERAMATLLTSDFARPD